MCLYQIDTRRIYRETKAKSKEQLCLPILKKLH